ncbi:MAG: redox-regulated ATPase YchF [Candidatus Odinarchaeia archaeon]
MLIGYVGKPSSGKSTFLNASCLTSAKTADYPFTTIECNPGVAYVRHPCVCKELNAADQPRNSMCIDGTRLIPIRILDVAGLVPDAWKGRGLGNKFLDDLRRADALVHVVDASGSLDAEGRPVEPGSWDPLKDVKFLDREITMWFVQIVKRDWNKILRVARTTKQSPAEILEEKLAGLGIKKTHILMGAKRAEVSLENMHNWSDEEIYQFMDQLRKIAKPMVIAANKIDKPSAEEGLKKLSKCEYPVIPTSALAEYHLRKYAQQGIIKYTPGDSDFEIVKPEKLTPEERGVLEKIREQILKKYGSTGVQQVLQKIVFEVLEMIAVFPVEDINNYTDHKGAVLPDVYLVEKGTTVREFAYKIHTDLGETFIHAIDARSKQRLGEDYILKDLDIIKIVSAKGMK